MDCEKALLFHSYSKIVVAEKTSRRAIWVEKRCSRPGMHNIRPAEAFDLALKTPIFVYLACFLKTPLECDETYELWPLDVSKKLSWVPHNI